MATRIRTVKPDLFRNEGLFELESETGLPVRLVFIGLFCCADREGRFKWRPRELTLDIMPYEDSTRLSRVLDALGTRGFVNKYRQGHEWYGFIPTFLRHQQINNREQTSFLPSISDADEVFAFDALEIMAESIENKELATRHPRVIHASTTRHEGKGREGKGREEDQDQKLLLKFDKKSSFDVFYKLYPRKVGRAAAEKKFATKVKDQETFDLIIASVGEHIQHVWSLCEKQYIPYPAKWLNQEQWNDEVSHVRPTNNANRQGSGPAGVSLLDQVRLNNQRRQAERARTARQDPAQSAELFDAGVEENGAGREWKGEFARIRDSDGKIVGVDD